MRHDRPHRSGLTVVEIILLVALIVLPLTLVLILFGKDIKRMLGGTFGSARTESEKLYKQQTGTGMGAHKGKVGAAATGDGSEGSSSSGASGSGSSSGSSGGDGGGTKQSAPVQSVSKAPDGGSAGRTSETGSVDSGNPSSNIGVAALAACVALIVAATMTRGKR